MEGKQDGHNERLKGYARSGPRLHCGSSSVPDGWCTDTPIHLIARQTETCVVPALRALSERSESCHTGRRRLEGLK